MTRSLTACNVSQLSFASYSLLLSRILLSPRSSYHKMCIENVRRRSESDVCAAAEAARQSTGITGNPIAFTTSGSSSPGAAVYNGTQPSAPSGLPPESWTQTEHSAPPSLPRRVRKPAFLSRVSGCPAAVQMSAQDRATMANVVHHQQDERQDLQDVDVLARATGYFRNCLLLGDRLLQNCRRSHYYSVLSRTTQPAHIVAFLAVTLVAVLLFPNQRSAVEPSSWTSLAYLIAFATHFGSQFWMTFVSGLSLFFSLPRHHFAEVQKVLFPLYFAINSSLSLVTLAAFLRLRQPGLWEQWDLHTGLQVVAMTFCFLLELMVRLYLTPPLLTLITTKIDIERSVEGIGQEVGRYELGPLAHCPHYLKVHAAFRRVHTSIAVANIAAMACTAFHAHYLANKICM